MDLERGLEILASVITVAGLVWAALKSIPRILRWLRRRGSGQLQPGTSPSFSPPLLKDIPHIRNDNFAGREEEIRELREHLTSGQEPGGRRVAIHGLGGVGKTQLAVQYAYRHYKEYEFIYWLRASQSATLVADYADIAQKQRIPIEGLKGQDIIEAVRRWFERSAGWLLVFDDARSSEGLCSCLPRGGDGHIIITSSSESWGDVAKCIKLSGLQPEEAIQYLMKRTGDGDREAAAQLAKELEYFPLALTQAGAYIAETTKRIRQYLKLYARQRKRLWKAGKPSDYPATLWTTWMTSFRMVRRQCPAAAALLTLCAFLAPDNIPIALLRPGAKDVGRVLRRVLTDDFEYGRAIGVLREYSLVEAAGETISVHQLVQQVSQDRLSRRQRRAWAEIAVRLVATAFPQESCDVGTWAECSVLLSHGLVAAAQAERLIIASVPTARLLNAAAQYLGGRANFADAEIAFRRALRILEATYGKDHPDVSAVVNNVGLILEQSGDFAEARRCFERALKIDEAAYGENHPSVAIGVNNLGAVLKDLGDLVGARRCFERALKIDEAAYGEGHPGVARNINNLGSVFQALGDLASSRQCFERALRLFEAAYGEDHPSVGTAVGNLGSVLQALGDITGARQCYERALRIDETAYGENHPSVARDVKNVGRALQALGDLIGARQCFERAEGILINTFGKDHPRVLSVQTSLKAIDEAMS